MYPEYGELGRGLSGEFRRMGRGWFTLRLEGLVKTPLFWDLWEATEGF